ncbi:crescerin-like protein che-12 [Macrosteles quadrilineatus]|uniref:crescerin-like protein che-12 n=1 Tax=Macrosteles quadrilineatus TaxID=74068 RepID=UPI0023E2BD02|nr:crescerin-like protein che-12 [Macrosteles quadrilineatus]
MTGRSVRPVGQRATTVPLATADVTTTDRPTPLLLNLFRGVRGERDGLKSVLTRQTRYPTVHTNGATPSLPSTPLPPQPARFVSPTPSLPPSPPERTNFAPSSQSLQVEDLSGDNASEEVRSRPVSVSGPEEPEPSFDQVDTLTVEEERLSTPPPPATPPPPPAVVEEPEPETLSEETVEHVVTGPDKFGKNTGKPRLKGKSSIREVKSVSENPEVPPFDSPKEALNRCLQQLENPEWEVIMLGLQSLVRLSCHHSTLVIPVLHQVVMALTKHVKNLRSQVARVACKAATYLFTSLGRGMENDMDELCAVLFNRTADTNKFLRADCNNALDAMVDSVSAHKSVGSIINKGAKHQNAIVRTAACRLLLRLCTRLGPQRTLNLPKDTRDSILNTGARSLTEGSLDTRRYAKEMFVLLGQDPRLTPLLMEVVPTSVMRSISKVLARLTSK